MFDEDRIMREINIPNTNDKINIYIRNADGTHMKSHLFCSN